jgi:protein-L-isoaspartate(D-aspartate) O-methyltransferase
VDPESAAVARRRYACLTPWEQDPAVYGAATMRGRYEECEPQVVAMLEDLLDKRLQYISADGQRFLNALQNARLVTNAERYYRIMYYGSQESWNLRDSHMFETLQILMDFRGPDSRAVVWAHNSHLGDASATEMGARGQHNVGQLCREEYEHDAYLVGFGTDHGTVAAASDWDGPMEIKDVRPAHPHSYEHLCHQATTRAFLLPLREPLEQGLRSTLENERLERAIGVVYRPGTELQSHYLQASLPHQFDEYIWFDETQAITPLAPEAGEGMPETFPFGV